MDEQKNKLYVGNLPYNLTNDGLREAFSQFGEITDAIVITDKFSGRSKGFGFVTMADDAAAQKAADEMNGKDFGGRPLTVNIARPMKPRR